MAFFHPFERQLDVGDEVVLTNGPITVSGKVVSVGIRTTQLQRRRSRFCTLFQIGISPSSAISHVQTRPVILADLWYNRRSLVKERGWFLEKQLGNDCTWIDLDVDKIKNMEDLSDVYGLDKETIEYALDRNERLIWTITVKRRR